MQQLRGVKRGSVVLALVLPLFKEQVWAVQA